MATFTPHRILRLLPMDLLREYATKHSINWLPEDADDSDDFSCKAAMFRNLSNSQRDKLEQMLRTVNEFRDEQGTQAIIDEAEFDGRSLGKELDEIAGHPAKALWCWIRYPDLFNRVWLMRTIEQTSNRYWYNLPGLQSVKTQCDDRAIRAMERSLQDYYLEKQARGRKCTVEHIARPDGEVYFYTHMDDYVNAYQCHDEAGKLRRNAFRPTFENVFIVTPQTQTLQIYAKGGRKVMQVLSQLFCQHILDCDPPDETESPTFELGRLLELDFDLPVDPSTGAKSALVSKVTVAPVGSQRRITLQADANNDRLDIASMFETHIPIAQFPHNRLMLTKASFKLIFYSIQQGRERTIRFDVSFPRTSNVMGLGDEEREICLHHLRQWGILCDQLDETVGDGGLLAATAQ